jgi:hypothetical protein
MTADQVALLTRYFRDVGGAPTPISPAFARMAMAISRSCFAASCASFSSRGAALARARATASS